MLGVFGALREIILILRAMGYSNANSTRLNAVLIFDMMPWIYYWVVAF